jgi:hypothetical protein
MNSNFCLCHSQDNIVESDMSVEPRHHRHFVARRGEVLHRISDECGGVMISFPRPGVPSDRVVLKGAKECIEMAKQRIQEIVTDLVSLYSHAQLDIYQLTREYSSLYCPLLDQVTVGTF